MKKILFGFVVLIVSSFNLNTLAAAELDRNIVTEWFSGLEMKVVSSNLDETAKLEAMRKIQEARLMLETSESQDLSVMQDQLKELVYELECEIKSAKKNQMESKLLVMAAEIDRYALAGEDVAPLISVHTMMTKKVSLLPLCQ